MSIVGDVLGGVLGAGAANDAAHAQEQGANKAADFLKQQQAAALAAQNNATQQQTNLAQPYTALGGQSANFLTSLLAPGGGLTKQWTDTFQAPTNVTEQNDPGYQFRLAQAQKAIQNSAAARGGLLSGGTAKALSDYSGEMASNEYGNVYNRALGEYQQRYGEFRNNQNDIYSRLMGATGLGQGSATNLSGLLQSGAINQGNINLSTGKSVADQYNNAAAARASGIMGANNAWTGMIGGLTGIGQGVLGDVKSLPSWLTKL